MQPHDKVNTSILDSGTWVGSDADSIRQEQFWVWFLGRSVNFLVIHELKAQPQLWSSVSCLILQMSVTLSHKKTGKRTCGSSGQIQLPGTGKQLKEHISLYTFENKWTCPTLGWVPLFSRDKTLFGREYDEAEMIYVIDTWSDWVSSLPRDSVSRCQQWKQQGSP